MGGNSKHRWKSFLPKLPSSPSSSPKTRPKDPPKEFICPISGSLMFDPVVISSGQTYERTSAQVCRDLSFSPSLPDGSFPDFKALIPNLALKSTIITWCHTVGIEPPAAPDYYSLQNKVRTLIDSSSNHHASTPASVPHAPSFTNLTNRNVSSSYSCSSDESVIANVTVTSSSSINSVEVLYDETVEVSNANSSSEEEEASLILRKLRSFDVMDHKNALIKLREITRINEEARVSMCTQPLLLAVRLALFSKFDGVQTNAAAAIVNLSLEKVNKVKIVRSGIVPPLIDVLKGGFYEAQEHAAGALFSLAVEDDNRTAIGVLGALEPLLHALRSESERTRNDSALALYNLSLIQSNRVKMIKLGAVTILLSLLENDDVADRILLVLCNMARCVEGKSIMLHHNAVTSLVMMLRRVDSESTRENCLAALYSLSQGNMRFRGLALQCGAGEVLSEVLNKKVSQLGREKVRVMLSVLRGREAEQEVDWERVMEIGPSWGGSL
ncbi:U-box domain-containing protein 39-like [Apium graveolens]|uniref:RING-type E3 ubiquitin transferase n=1 Tax=Apium graveolens TaxID=4045 RepID=A0A6L5BBW1_APIGR|nr:hypothetical protein AG4045_001322 [Apium graveolens]